MNYLKQLISDGELPSVGRVVALTIVIPIMIVWAILCIRAGEFIKLPWEMVATILGAIAGKTAQSFSENASTPSVDSTTVASGLSPETPTASTPISAQR